MTSDGAVTGVAAVVGLLLVVAGAEKLAVPARFAASLRRLAGPFERRGSHVAQTAAVAVGAVEVATGAALPVAPGLAGVAAAVVATGLAAAFVVAVARAIRLGEGCACFGRLGRTRAGGRELGRALALTSLAAALAGERLASPDGNPTIGWAALPGAALAAGLLLAAMLAGERLRPAPGSGESPAITPPRRLLEMLGADDQLSASRSALEPLRRAPGAVDLPSAQARALAAGIEAHQDTALVTAHLAEAGCRRPRWRAAVALRWGDPDNPADERHVVEVPTEQGCALVAFIPPSGSPLPPMIVGCHRGACAFVHAGRLVAGGASFLDARPRSEVVGTAR